MLYSYRYVQKHCSTPLSDERASTSVKNKTVWRNCSVLLIGNSRMLILKIIIVWFLISLVFSLVFAQFLNLNDTSEEELLANQ